MSLSPIEAMTLHEVSSLYTSFLKTFNQASPLLNYCKGNTSRFGSAIQVSPPDIGEYFSSFFIAGAVIVFISVFIL